MALCHIPGTPANLCSSMAWLIFFFFVVVLVPNLLELCRHYWISSAFYLIIPGSDRKLGHREIKVKMIREITVSNLRLQDPSAEESQLSRSLCIQYLEASVTAVRPKHFSRSQPGHSPWAYEKYRKNGQWEILGLNNLHSFMEDPCLTGGLTITALACF